MINYRVLLIAFLLTMPAVFSHGNENVWERLGIVNPADVLLWSGAISGFFILASLLYRSGMGKNAKKVSFIFISVPVLVGTLYMAGTTIYLNAVSATGGPIHWHADYEVWACGHEYELVDPEGIENRIGTPAVHEHNDNRIHVEGVLLDMSDASLQEFFEDVGGEFTDTSLSMPTHEGMKTWSNGDLCNGSPAMWYIFVNGKMSTNMGRHIIAPYPDVPPGDRIKLVFSEKPADKINPNTGVEP